MTMEQNWLCHILNPLKSACLSAELYHHLTQHDETKHVNAAGYIRWYITAIVVSAVHAMQPILQLNLAG